MRALFLVPLLALLAIPSARAADAGAPSPPSPVPGCVRVTTQSRWIPYGYNHIVILENGCSKPATCTVSTDVNPQRQSAEVASGTSAEIVTFMGSASSTFNASVACSLH